MSKVIFINPFEVPTGQEDDYLFYLEQGYKHRKKQPGFISARLHRAVSPNSRFKFISVAEWQSAEHLQKALNSKEFKTLVSPKVKALPHYPGIYKGIGT